MLELEECSTYQSEGVWRGVRVTWDLLFKIGTSGLILRSRIVGSLNIPSPVLPCHTRQAGSPPPLNAHPSPSRLSQRKPVPTTRIAESYFCLSVYLSVCLSVWDISDKNQLAREGGSWGWGFEVPSWLNKIRRFLCMKIEFEFEMGGWVQRRRMDTWVYAEVLAGIRLGEMIYPEV